MRQPVPFGKYLLLDRISVGGMAEVFKAKSYGVEGFEKIIAIKRILPTMGEDRDFIKMFIDEAKIAGQLAHANICQIFELGRIDGSHFIAMEYIWGKDLLQIQNRLRKIKQPMPIAMACFTIAKVLEGLDYAHRKRDPLGRPLEIVHRDCSPQNVLVSYEGEVKVIDFGIAKATSRNSRTMAGVLKGKFGYMSPEQVRGLPLDRRSDIFALGTMLYECLTGDRLFQGETDFSTLEKVRNVDVRPPREINPAIPPVVEAVIMKALAKDVDERYQWCSEMLADLQAFLMSQDVVFTAKSLSGWLKDVFQAEIDRERQQLEQYKRVGRDGLIAGVPAAEAKMDVVATLGEAPPVEGDPTVLGGPNFDDLEHAAGAAPEVGPAPGSPAARGGPLDQEDDGGEDFGEEAPTEIFGEIDHGANPAAAVPSASSRAPTAAQSPLTRPPKPPPSSRPLTTRGEPGQPMAALPGLPGVAAVSPSNPPRTPAPSELGFQPAAATPSPGFAGPGYGSPPGADAPYAPYGQPPGQHPGAGYSPPGPTAGSPLAAGTSQPAPAAQPGSLGTPAALPMNGGAPGAQGRTLLGASPPPGLPNYSQGYPPQFAQHAGQPHPGQPGMPHPGKPGMQHPGQPGMQHPEQHGMQHPGQPGMQHPGQHGMQHPGQPGMQHPGQPGMQHPGQHGMQHPGQPGMQPPPGYGAPYSQMPHDPYAAPGQVPQGVPPVEQAPQADKKKSSILRDVAIGVAIAALVLAGFLAVKYLILDDGAGPAEPSARPTSIATIRLAMMNGVNAELFVDDKKVATVSDKQEIQVTAGDRKVKLVGANGAHCEKEMTLAAGKTTVLECAMAASAGSGSAGGSAAVGVAAAGGSAAELGSAGGSGSAAELGSAAGSGSAAETGSAAGSGSAGAGSSTTGAGSAAGSGATSGSGAGSGSAAGSAALAAGSNADKPAEAAAVPDKMPVEDKPKPADASATKPAPAVATKPPVKPADTTATKPPVKPADTTATKPRPAKPAPVEDDPLGVLQGGSKPGDKKPDPKKPADEPSIKSAAKPAADAKGYLTVNSKPAAKILVDGVDTGLSTPIGGRALPLAPGKHKVTFVIKGDKFAFTVTIKPGETTSLDKDLE